MTDLPKRLGVVGAGTMGAGIAQLGALANIETVVHDPIAQALERGMQQIHANLQKGADRGRWSEADASAAGERLSSASEIGELSGCELVIEAAPEKFELKRELFQQLGDVCGDDAV